MALPLGELVDRRMKLVAQQRMRDEPVVALQGPRAVGKTTLLREIAAAHGTEIIDLDDLATRDAVAADPATFVSGPAPVCIDEYQHAPLVLDAIKAELNKDTRPGRFVITGSTRHDALPRAAQALTGRLHLMTIHPLSQGEIAETHEDLIDRLFSDTELVVGATASTTSREDYISRVVAGGFPPALQRGTEVARARWFDDYITLCLERDVAELARIQQKAALPQLLARLAAQTGQVLNIAAAGEAARLKARTAENYTRLLEALFLLHRLPAWGTTLRARAAAMPKLHVMDSGLAARLLRLTAGRLGQRNPTALQQFGHLLETFVVGETLKQVSWMDGIAAVGHWRTHDGAEVDLVIERNDGSVVAIEVKAGTRVSGRDLAGLRVIRDELGDAFAAGVVMYTGARSYSADDRIAVLPIDRLWTASR
jgi:predicted AAA+ superfamily ATPase